MQQTISKIENIWQERDNLLKNQELLQNAKEELKEIINWLDSGKVRICEYNSNGWVVNQWLKKAILLYLYVGEMELYNNNCHKWYDKVPPKFIDVSSTEDFKKYGCRIVPGSIIRTGSYIAPNVVVMPSFINIGAYIDEGSMIDTWATIGSCAQIGRNCHISGGTGIGGVLEPIQNNPVIIEDDCFIGARSEIVEGVIVEKGAVIGMGVFIGASTKIVNRETGEITYGRVPQYSVVVSGTLPSADIQKPSLYCAVIVKQVDQSTRAKTSINDLLRS
jgi:2,3,4,5-tetrahydropyridine-2,6-dicarboxylate N-succinyltransferase